MGSSAAHQWAMIGFALFCGSAAARSSEAPVNVLGNQGIAVYGHDPVAYFTDGEARKGQDQLWTEHDGVRWLFSSDASKRLFEQDPERYTPAYGGFCANGVAKGLLLDADPQSWMIVYGRLYLNCPKLFNGFWFNDTISDIKQADDNWLHLTGHLPIQVMLPRKRPLHSDP
ncbi:YHS domain-containing (seleno)protein [Microvirga mediterraneensis]|jgi:YHS domain-containing protein|uniref:YHS domain-containing protein n=1 Tax=Microvirga mediterraneensis TaxID=2754695 RepID=A0A838BTW9_9HYPH|nr:YHS domain-containing (seleno)protein [Microvirga mediterraneensis]MBA1158871.1 YHS domain-containing protein [Microvirga mediterraneensis]